MNKYITIVIVAIMAVISNAVYAQHFPVGIVSTQDTVKAVQMGIISSVAEDGGRGLQLSGVSNTSAHLFNGLQLGGVSNITRGMSRGLQLSGILNVSSAMMRGWQWGAVNYADSLDGAQIGVFNVARRRPKGWQIGLVNLSYDSIGHKIGLVNVSPKTKIPSWSFTSPVSGLSICRAPTTHAAPITNTMTRCMPTPLRLRWD